MKKAQKRMILMAVGILAAGAIIFSQLFYYQSVEHAKKEVKTEQRDSSSQEEAFFSVPSASMPSSTHVELSHEPILLLEILFEDDEVVRDHEQTTLHLNAFLQTLFSAIISPNAP